MNLVPDLYRKGCYQHSAFKVLERGMWFFQEWIPGSTVVAQLGSKPDQHTYYNEHNLEITDEALLEIVKPLFHDKCAPDLRLCGIVSERKFWLYGSQEDYWWQPLAVTEKLATRTKFCVPQKWVQSCLPDFIRCMRREPAADIFGVIAQPACAPIYAPKFGRIWGKVMI